MKILNTYLLAASLVFTAPSFAEQFSDIYKQYTAAIKQKKHPLSLALAKKALTLGEAKFAKNSENITNLQYNLADAYANNKKYLSAFKTMALVTESYKTLYGEHSEQLFQAILSQLDHYPNKRVHSVEDKDEILQPLVEQAIDIAEQLVTQKPDISHVIYYLLSKQISKKTIFPSVRNQATHYSQLAYEGLLNKLGSQHVQTLEAQFRLAGLEYNARKFHRAAELFEALVTNIESSIDTSHPYELLARGRLVNIYERIYESEKATEHCIAIGKMKPWEENLKPQPLFRLNPKYPKKAAMDNKQGLAKMSFSINEKGFVKDIQVIKSEGGREFEKESIAALKKWRYAPKFKNGKAVTATNLTVLLDFKMDKS